MRFSLITVTLNDVANLTATAESVVGQVNVDFQWIIKDGESSDGTTQLVEKLKSDHPGMNILYVSKKDVSLYDAMNQAIDYAEGAYSLFLNAGDVLVGNNTLQKAARAAGSDTDYDFIYGDNIDKLPDGGEIYKKARELSYLWHSIPSSHQSIFYRTALLKEFRYDTSYKICADYEITARIYFNGHQRYLKLDFPISSFSLGGVSQQYRKILLNEGYLVHRRIVKYNPLVAGFKYIQRMLTFILLDEYPGIYKSMRKLMDKKFSIGFN